jgi:acid phosphatase
MYCHVLVSLLLIARLVVADSTTSEPPESTINPAASVISAAASTATPISPTSNVRGLAFDRFYQIWLENTDYDAAAGDPNIQYVRTSPQLFRF